jgi:hypothetical protein
VKLDLIDEARTWWKLNSIQVGAFWALLGGVIVTIWPVASWGLNMVLGGAPLWVRALAGSSVTIVTGGSYIYARLRAQAKPNG